MGKIILISGGARSGKSTYAENLAKEYGNKVKYIATAIPFDDEMKLRVKLHKESRPTSWHTYESYRNLEKVYSINKDFEVILLDCVTVMISNLLFDSVGVDFEALNNDDFEKMEKEIMEEFVSFIDAIVSNSQTVIMVTNELGSGIVPEYKSGRVFRDIAGRVNQYIAMRANEVYLTVCGIPIKIK
jgi:adenosylcobinamide kinase / adenosylcobinamide-phosphate guanylyltransferase